MARCQGGGQELTDIPHTPGDASPEINRAGAHHGARWRTQTSLWHVAAASARFAVRCEFLVEALRSAVPEDGDDARKRQATLVVNNTRTNRENPVVRMGHPRCRVPSGPEPAYAGGDLGRSSRLASRLSRSPRATRTPYIRCWLRTHHGITSTAG